MKRQILQKLQEWRTTPDRKPLVLHGVRQCGKTFILQEFGKTFRQCHYFNFEKQSDWAAIFQKNLDPKRILLELQYAAQQAIDIKQDLVVFDEIQICSQALTSLKYFNEELPELALCSAGSLLGLSLNESSFPVGKVNLLNMYPLSFSEFLLAIGESQLHALIEHCNTDTEIPLLAHQQLWEKMLWYWIVGGLPEAITTFNQHKENLFIAFQQVRAKQNEILRMYYADIAKHSGKVNALQIDRVWQATPTQLARTQDGAANKFKFKDIIPGASRYNRLANAIDWLGAANLIIKVPIVNSAAIPLNAYTQESAFKLFMFDVGLLGAMSDLPVKSILEHDYGTYKGFFAENFVAQELLAADHSRLFCWQENRAEVEFLLTLEDGVIPIEVKSGWITRAKSLQQFIDKYHPAYATLMSGHPLKIQTSNKHHYYPLYLAGKFPLS
jgi:predicted AAA+ superfamily ATPase